MKQKSLLVLVLAAFFVLIQSPPSRAGDDEVSVEYFSDSLAPYGEWIEVQDYGYCWHPSGVDQDWAPYTDGYWAYTDAGWTWVSYEDFGGIVYHYGRWTRVEGEGWCWQPDYEWAPAWVSWRSNDDYVGWAPLPPEARWRRDVGFSVWVDSECDIGPGYYSFCRTRDFGAPVLRGVILKRGGNVLLMRNTNNITNTTYNNYGGSYVVFNGGPDFARLRGITSRPIPALRLVQNAHVDLAAIRAGGGGKLLAAQTVGNQLIVSAPVVRAPVDPNFLKGKTKKFIQADKVNRGWAGVKDATARQELKQQIQAQAKGLKPETAHARPVAAAELQVVPTQANPVAQPAAEGRPRGRNEGKNPATATTNPPVQPSTGAVREVPAVDPQAGKSVTGKSPNVRKGRETPEASGVNPDVQRKAQAEAEAKSRAMRKDNENATAAQAQKDAQIAERKNADAQRRAQTEAEAKARSMQKDNESATAAQGQREAQIAERKNADAQRRAQAEAEGKARSMQKENQNPALQAEKEARRQEREREMISKQQQPQNQPNAGQKPPREESRHAQPAPEKPAPAETNSRKGGNAGNDKGKGKDKDKDKDKDKNGN